MTMEGKRFGIGLVAGVLLAVAIVTASGGLGSTPFTGSFAFNAASTTTTTTVVTTIAATSTIASSTITMTTTAVPQTTSFTSTLSIASTTSGSWASVSSNMTYPAGSISSSSTIVTSTLSSVSSATSNSTPGSLTAAASAASGTPFGFLFPPGVNRPTQVASITRQPVVTNAEILAPVLVAFLLGAFLYRIAVQEREKSSGD